MKKFLFATVLLLVGGGSAAAQTPITAAGVKSTTVNSSNRNEIFAITDQMLVTGKVGPLVFAEHDGVGVQISGIEAEKGDIITDIVGKLTKVSYAKNAFTATECTKVSSGNVVTPFVVSKADVVSKSAELDARLVMVEEVNFEAAAASNGIFNMTVTPAQSDLGIMLSVTGSIPYVTPANVSGYITWSQMGAAMMSMKAVSIVGDPSLFVLPTEISNIDDLLTFPVKFPAAREISASGYSPLAAIFDASGDAYAIAFGSRFGDCQFEGNEAIFHFVRIADLTAELKKAARSLVASHVGSVDAGSATVFICGKSFKIDGQLYELPISKTYDYNAGLTTGIHAISESIDAPAYDLNGRVMKPVSGQMFIKNGKKVIK